MRLALRVIASDSLGLSSWGDIIPGGPKSYSWGEGYWFSLSWADGWPWNDSWGMEQNCSTIFFSRIWSETRSR